MEVGTAKESHPVRAVNRACGPFLLLLVVSCAGGPGDAPVPSSHAEDLLLLNRVTWGANPSSARELARMGPERYLEAQLQPAQETTLPPQGPGAGGRDDHRPAPGGRAREGNGEPPEGPGPPAQRRREEGGAAGVPAGAHAP